MKNKKTIVILSNEKESTTGNIIKELYEKEKDIITVLIGEKELNNVVANFIDEKFLANKTFLKRIENNTSKYIKGFLNKMPKISKKEKPISFNSKSPIHKKVKNILLRYNPDLVICLSHAILKPAIAAKNMLNLECNIVSFIDRYYLDERFVNKETDLYLVDNDDIKEKLQQKGIDSEKIKIANIPVKLNFKNKVDKATALKHFELEDKPTILLISTIYGDDRLKKAINEIIEAKFDINVIVAAGYNDNLIKFVNELYRPNIRVVDQDIDMNIAMSLSDIIITRPTTMVLTEALYKERLIFSLFSVGEEEFLTEEYFGYDLIVKLKDEKEMRENIKKYLDDKKTFDDRLKYIKDANIGEPSDRLYSIINDLIEVKEETEENNNEILEK